MLAVVALYGVALLLLVGVFAIFAAAAAWASRAVYGACLCACSLLFVLGLSQLLSGGVASVMHLPLGLPWIGAHFRLDALSGFFLCVVDFGGMAASVYALGYGRHETNPGRILPFFAAFLAGMNLVVLAADAFSFLVAWEFMSFSSWALVNAHHHATENTRAGYVYLLMASFGTLTLLLAFGLLAGPSGSYAFDAMRQMPRTAELSGLVLILALVGTGSKAGLVPLHVWLPLAHPAAPSHVSALMSGVMTKVAVYGFVRIAFDLVGQPAPWWSMLIIAVAGVTAVLGVLRATLQRDVKVLLAYSTIENIGIVFVGLGLALAFKANGMAAEAALAFTAALFHVLNHSLIKSLLFFGAGAVLSGTGSRDIEQLGGLIHKMPRTAFVFLGGSLAISALPPLNGFASEWLLFQAVLVSPALPQWGLDLLVPVIGVMLALAAALSAACFVRAYGTTFLGRPRSPAAQEAHEVDPLSLGAMTALLALCVFAGIFPALPIDAIGHVAHELVGAQLPLQTEQRWLSLVPIDPARSSYNGLLVFLFVAISATLAAAFIHRAASRQLRRAPAWDCGFPNPSPRAQYSADSFAQPLRRVFGETLFRAREKVDMPLPGDLRPAVATIVVRRLIWEKLYLPLVAAVLAVARRIDGVQFLTIRQYLSLVFVALVGLLLVVAVWP
jgi:formate hydrogenlyase subunit 3/multisubunit Na+/H+ antiporter MnhD subunit